MNGVPQTNADFPLARKLAVAGSAFIARFRANLAGTGVSLLLNCSSSTALVLTRVIVSTADTAGRPSWTLHNGATQTTPAAVTPLSCNMSNPIAFADTCTSDTAALATGSNMLTVVGGLSATIEILKETDTPIYIPNGTATGVDSGGTALTGVTSICFTFHVYPY